jgi:hypothetical protein
VEAGIIHSTQEIDGVEYVFLGREDEGAGGGAGGECGCFESWLFVCRGMKSDLVDDSSVGMLGKDMVRSSCHTFTNSDSDNNHNINDDSQDMIPNMGRTSP